ncbi:AAA family ATPase [Halomonas maura]|uniref:AAA family ATPase n=1 Tax=Halomonas maura TaxID=117606 RepID=UPI0025B4D3A5|nr:AAA family ATPase [Halomonas maura]MDN3558200.1 AAA family ATPase [Halomonas maura]
MMKVQIAKIRESGVRAAWEIAEDGSIIRQKHTLCLRFPAKAIGAAEVGTVWNVDGLIKNHTFKAGEYEITERHMKVKKLEFLRPCGELLARWIAANIEGVGEVKANRLVRQFPDLDQRVREKDVAALSSVAGVSVESAYAIVEKWPSERFYAALEWLQKSKLPLSLAQSLARVYDDPVKTISDDPLILTAFGVSFKDALKLVKRIKIDIPESRILAAVAEQVAVKYCYETGSTVIPEGDLLAGAIEVCESIGIDPSQVVEASLTHGSLLKVENGFQSLGSAIQERTVGRFLKQCNERPQGAGSIVASWEAELTEERIVEALKSFEGSLPFTMTDEQREAVVGAVKFPVSVISGGAGTGKTTILLAMLAIYDQLSIGLAQYQVALSGRAAQRMAESTGRQAQTIAKFISDHFNANKPDLEEHVLLVIDEASMVDLISAYKIVGLLPYATRIVMVGDVSQLPPVGGGLIFHAAMNSALPVFELTQVKRQGEQSGIHQLATAVRTGKMDSSLFNSASGDTRYIPQSTHEALLKEYVKARNGAECIVLTPTRKGPLGVTAINKLIQAQYDEFHPQELYYKESNFMEWLPWITSSGAKLRLGDHVMVTRNDYNVDIRNGDLGVIAKVYDRPSGGSYGVMQINGNDIDITDDTIQSIDLGYAITIHKSQGSQWAKCILMLPSYASRMTDQSLIYTAVTRPTKELVLMGDSVLIDRALRRGNLFSKRITNISASLPMNE